MTTTDTAPIEKAVQGAINGDIHFLEVVQQLQDASVSRYYVDPFRAEFTVYLRDGGSHIVKVPISNEVAQQFSASDIESAVSDSYKGHPAKGGQTWLQFVDRILKAGCIGYAAYLDGKRTLYFSSLGEQYVEQIPSTSQVP